MENKFIELLEELIPAKKTTTAVNADKYIERNDIKDLCMIVEMNYEESCDIMKKLLINRKQKTIPLLYRRALGFLAYRLYHKTKKEGAQAKVLNDLGLGHNNFTDWGIYPIMAYHEEFYKPREINLYRDGKKNKKLCYVFNKLASQVEYDKFVDVFGGLGVVTASKYPCSIEYINDFDISLSNFLLTIGRKPKELKKACEKLLNDIKCRKDINILNRGKEEYKKRKKKDIDLLDEEQEYVEYAVGLYKKFQFEIKEYQESRGDKNISMLEPNIEKAVAFYYIHAFQNRGRPAITGVTISGIDNYKHGLNKIQEYGERFKNVQILCKDFRDVINEFDSESTLMYLDSPYFSMKEYHHKFTEDDQLDLMNVLRESKSKWIFSFRTNTSSVINEGEETEAYMYQIRCISGLLKKYEGIAKNVVEIKIGSRIVEIMMTNFDFKSPVNLSNFKKYLGRSKSNKKRYTTRDFIEYSREWRIRDIY